MSENSYVFNSQDEIIWYLQKQVISFYFILFFRLPSFSVGEILTEK